MHSTQDETIALSLQTAPGVPDFIRFDTIGRQRGRSIIRKLGQREIAALLDTGASVSLLGEGCMPFTKVLGLEIYWGHATSHSGSCLCYNIVRRRYSPMSAVPMPISQAVTVLGRRLLTFATGNFRSRRAGACRCRAHDQIAEY